MDDDGGAISYKVLAPGTPVRCADGTELGTVLEVLDNEREDIFDGIHVATPDGTRFVDAPEIGRITEASVTLTIDAAEAAELPGPQQGAPVYRADVPSGRVGRFFKRGGWKRE